MRDLAAQVEAAEAALGAELRERLQPLADRYGRAARDGDPEGVFARTCPARHGRWGRICVLDAGHEDIGPHFGRTNEGAPVAWLGTAPDAP